MGYSNRFQVRDWLETPAKWLSWAIDSTENLQEMAWNLQEFWKALEPLKSGNRSTRQWGEILLLDSRAQSTLGHLYLLQAALKAKSASVYAVDISWVREFVLFVPVFGAAKLIPQVKSFLAKNDPGIRGYQADIKKLYDQAQAAFKKASEMAAKAKKALASSDPVMATRAQAMAKNGQIITTNSRGQTAQMIEDFAEKSGPQLDLPKLITSPIGGIPLWGWLAGIAAVALIVTTGPTVVAVSRARRMAA